MKTFRIAELFSGPGGFGLGAKNAGMEHLWASDIDPDSCATHHRNIGSNVLNMDIRRLVSEFPSERPEGITFGFPCNDFSNVGETSGLNGQYGRLYQYAVKAVEHYRPRWFVAENVTGLRSANEGRAFEVILSDLEGAGGGYALTTHLYKFEEYGIPQRRHRIIIVGIARELGLKFRVPAPSGRTMTAREALANIPENAPNHEFTRQSPLVVQRLRHIPPGENAWHEGIPPHLRLNVKGARLSHIYRRLDPDKPAYTVTGSGGGGTHVYHWKENRALTNRERARLQTFPDDFEFLGSKESARRQIGMAVPPDGAKIIFEAVLKTFAGVEYEGASESFAPSEKSVQSA